MPSPEFIDITEVADMVAHDVGCPPNGYLGQPYGVSLKPILQTPMVGAGVANDVIEKIKTDVPLAARLGPGALNLFAYDANMDVKAVVVEVGGVLIQVDGGGR
jgi:hypothetical protein